MLHCVSAPPHAHAHAQPASSDGCTLAGRKGSSNLGPHPRLVPQNQKEEERHRRKGKKERARARARASERASEKSPFRSPRSGFSADRTSLVSQSQYRNSLSSAKLPTAQVSSARPCSSGRPAHTHARASIADGRSQRSLSPADTLRPPRVFDSSHPFLSSSLLLSLSLPFPPPRLALSFMHCLAAGTTASARLVASRATLPTASFAPQLACRAVSTNPSPLQRALLARDSNSNSSALRANAQRQTPVVVFTARRSFASSTMVAQKIKVKGKVVEMDGDEMTRIIWHKIRDEVRTLGEAEDVVGSCGSLSRKHTGHT